MARRSEFNQEVADAICERIAQGESLRAICRDDGMPVVSTVCKWLTQQSAFAEQYARAREIQADTLFDEILEIADYAKEDTYIDSEGRERTDQEVIGRSRLRVDARKWMAGKLRPKVYGDKSSMEVSGIDGGPIDHSLTVTFVDKQ